MPPGVVNMVFGNGAVTGSALVKSQQVAGVSFTGGTATGIQIRKDTIADISKHLSLELGGKNPTLIFDDVDLQKAVPLAAKAAFENQGEVCSTYLFPSALLMNTQICLCGSRIYVQKSIFDTFIAEFKKCVTDNYTCRDTLGAVVSLSHYQKIRSYLIVAEQEGANFELGSIPKETPNAGYWIDPTVLTGVSTSSVVMREEIFGPVVTIAPFETEAEAINLANHNPNGLASILMTKDGSRMRRVGEQLEAGLVWVNCWLVRELGTPFGGMKNSGTGREGGAYSRDVFTHVRTLHIPDL